VAGSSVRAFVGGFPVSESPGKTRTRAHVLADLSINYVERQLLLSGSAVQRVRSDNGYDLAMSTFDADGQIEPGVVYFQVKATDHLRLLADGQAVALVLSRRDLRLWLDELFPVILVLYDGQRNRAYWLDIQAHFAGRSSAELFLAAVTVTGRVPVAQRFNPRSVRRIIRGKNRSQARFQGKGRGNV
jgi:hypothetical protein